VIPHRLLSWRALLLAAAAVLAAPAQASLPGLDDLATASQAPTTSLQTAMPRELPGPCEGDQCGEPDAPQPKTRVRGFELDLYCRLGGEDGLSCRPRQVWLEEYGEGASDRLVYAKARYFDPELGRFLSQDSYLGELTEPPSLHRYLYANDNPTRYVDPTGHMSDEKFSPEINEQRELKKKEAQAACLADLNGCLSRAMAAQEAGQRLMNRITGTLKAIGGGLGVLGGGALAMNAEIPGAPVAGLLIMERSAELAHSGTTQMVTAVPDETRQEAVVQQKLEELGLSREEAALIKALGFTSIDALGGALGARSLAPTTPSGKALETPQIGPMGRGNQKAYADQAEELVSEHTGVPRNPQGPGQQTIPGSGSGGTRVPDLKVRGPEGSVRLRGTVIEVKASRGTSFGDLSDRSRKQLLDAVAYARRLRARADMVKDGQTRTLLENARVEVFSDLPAPTSGKFADLVEQGLIEWKAIPR